MDNKAVILKYRKSRNLNFEMVSYYKKYFNKIGFKPLLLILIGSIAWSLTMIKSGLVYEYGMGFWGPNGHDGVWHLSLINGLLKGDWEIMMFVGESIKNYHIGFDLFLASFHKTIFIPVVNLYFQVLPVIFSLLIGSGVYMFVYTWQKDRSRAFWATFFTYFAGSFGWIITYFRSGEFGGESMFWSQQSLSTLINPPYALSLVFIFFGLTFLIYGLKKNNKKYLMIASVLFGLLIQVKVYAGVLMLASLFMSGLWNFFKRGGISLLKVFCGAFILAFVVFVPTIGSSSSMIVYKPFWFLETMMSTSDRVGWLRLGDAMVNYKLGGVWGKAILAYTISFAVFMLGNLGLRVLGIKYIVSKIRKFRNLGWVEVFIFTTIVIGIVVPMVFVQKGTAWNTIQFFYYSLMFMGILGGITFAELLTDVNKPVSQLRFRTRNGILITGVIALTYPVMVATMRNYLPGTPPAMISKEELKALKFLSDQPEGTVLTAPFDKSLADQAINNPPRSLYLYESTAYVSAFSKKNVFLEDEMNLEITGYDWKERKQELIKVLGDNDNEILRDFLNKYNIGYIYWIKRGYDGQYWVNKGFEKVFENDEVLIYRVE